VNLVGEVDDAILRLLTVDSLELLSLGLGGRRGNGSEGSVDTGSTLNGGNSTSGSLLGDTETERNDSGDVIIGTEAVATSEMCQFRLDEGKGKGKAYTWISTPRVSPRRRMALRPSW